MVIQKMVKLTFPKELVKKPIIYEMIRRYDILTNIVQAQVAADEGWIILEIRGEEAVLQSALEWVAGEGVQVRALTAEEEAACRS
jgi:ABC-type methionine transport system ATPase subunit